MSPRHRRGLLTVALLLQGTACGRSGLLPPTDGTTPTPSPTVTASPTPTPGPDPIRFTSIVLPAGDVYPGRFGVLVETTLVNETTDTLEDVRAVLLVLDSAGTSRESEFRHREADAREAQPLAPREVPPGEALVIRFVLDVMPWADPAGDARVNASATFLRAAAPGTATGVETPPALAWAPVTDRLVTISNDEDDGDLSAGDLSFREAVRLANETTGIDRVRFDPVVFPPDGNAIIALEDTLPDLALDGTGAPAVIDASGARVTLEPDAQLPSSGRYALTLVGPVTVHGLRFLNLGSLYPQENLNQNCANNGRLTGGAVRINGGTGVVVFRNEFTDPLTAERSCLAASNWVFAGGGHRILENVHTSMVADAWYVDANVHEIAGNVYDGSANATRTDDVLFFLDLHGGETWVVGNLLVDHEISGVVNFSNDGTLHVLHNTFARHFGGFGAVRRGTGTTGPLRLRNNLFSDNGTALVIEAGANANIAELWLDGDTLCSGGCAMATVDLNSIGSGDPMLVDDLGNTREDFTPASGSPLIDAASDELDINGARPGRFDGAGPDLGAVEVPQE